MSWLFLAFCSYVYVLESACQYVDWDVIESINVGNLTCLQYGVFLSKNVVYLSIYFHHQGDWIFWYEHIDHPFNYLVYDFTQISYQTTGI